MATTIPDPKPETAIARSDGASIGFGLSAANWDEGFRIAKVLANSSLVPKVYQGKPEDVIVAMQYGSELGMPPMSALQSIAVVNGKPALYGDGFLAVVMTAPAYAAHVEFYVTANGEETYSLTQADLAHDETRAVAKFYRRGVAAPFVSEFSIADAKRARLWNKEGGWQSYPARMLKWRARGFAARDAFADQLRGIKIDAEVADEDMPSIEAPPIVAPVRRSHKLNGLAVQDAIHEVAQEPPAPPPDDDPIFPDIPANLAPPLPPLPETSKPAPPIRSIKPDVTAADVVITDTAFVQRKGEEPYFEVRARVAAEGKAPIAYVFLTRDKPLYELAASAEGTPQTFAVTWRNAKRADGTACKILESIEAS